MPRPAKGLIHFSPGDSCKGKTNDGREIIGHYIQAGAKDFAYIKGVIAVDGLASPFESLQIFKVLRSSLRKIKPKA